MTNIIKGDFNKTTNTQKLVKESNEALFEQIDRFKAFSVGSGSKLDSILILTLNVESKAVIKMTTYLPHEKQMLISEYKMFRQALDQFIKSLET